MINQINITNYTSIVNFINIKYKHYDLLSLIFNKIIVLTYIKFNIKLLNNSVNFKLWHGF